MRISDWSSDVCSSDLQALGHPLQLGVVEILEDGKAAQQLGRGSAHVDRRHGPAAGVDVLGLDAQIAGEILADDAGIAHLLDLLDPPAEGEALEPDRKGTRLNSSP